MNDTKEGRKGIYEIGYQIVPSIPEEKVEDESKVVRGIITNANASIISEEAPHLEPLAYTIKKKTVSGSYDKFNKAYFGWIKFEVETDKIEAITKAVEKVPSMLRSITITTVRENTYLGKKASAIVASIPTKMDGDVKSEKLVDEKKEVVPMSVEDVDKSIDEMVKES